MPSPRLPLLATALLVLAQALPAPWTASRVLAQAPLPIAGLRTVFADDPQQWDLLDADDERVGELRLRFPGMGGQLGDLSQWSLRCGDLDAVIRRKVRGRDDLWEVRVGGDLAVARTLFPGRYDEWRVEAGGEVVVYAARDGRLLEYWGLRGAEPGGDFAVYTTYEGDWREWTVADDSAAGTLSTAAQVALIWLPVYLRLTAL